MNEGHINYYYSIQNNLYERFKVTESVIVGNGMGIVG